MIGVSVDIPADEWTIQFKLIQNSISVFPAPVLPQCAAVICSLKLVQSEKHALGTSLPDLVSVPRLHDCFRDLSSEHCFDVRD